MLGTGLVIIFEVIKRTRGKECFARELHQNSRDMLPKATSLEDTVKFFLAFKRTRFFFLS
jgi:hypothetical protein